MHKDRKHIDFRSYDDSEVIENYLFNNSRNNYKYLEDSYIEELEHQELRKAINDLPEVQKSRLIKYYFYDKTYEEIANEEKCSKVAIKYSIDTAIEKISKKFKI